MKEKVKVSCLPILSHFSRILAINLAPHIYIFLPSFVMFIYLYVVFLGLFF